MALLPPHVSTTALAEAAQVKRVMFLWTKDDPLPKKSFVDSLLNIYYLKISKTITLPYFYQKQ